MVVAASASRPGPFAVFRNRDFALLWSAQFITTMGGGLTAIAASILVYRETGSALSVGLVMLPVALPSLFVGLIAGVFVDRYDRKRIMIAAEVIRAALVAAIPLLLPYGIGRLSDQSRRLSRTGRRACPGARGRRRGRPVLPGVAVPRGESRRPVIRRWGPMGERPAARRPIFCLLRRFRALEAGVDTGNKRCDDRSSS